MEQNRKNISKRMIPVEEVCFLNRRFEELDKEKVRTKMLESGWYIKYLTSNWDTVDGKEDLLKYLHTDFFNEPFQQRGLFVHGNIGVGKTSLLALIGGMLEKYFTGHKMFFSSPVLFDSLFSRNHILINNIRSAAALFIDDLGWEYKHDFSLMKFNEIIEHRYANYMPTFFTSNLPLSDLLQSEHFKRIADRINDGAWCKEFSYTGKTKREKSQT